VCKLIVTNQVYVSIDVVLYALPWWQLIGLMTTDTLYFHFTRSFLVSFWGSGIIFWASRTSFLLKENHYSIGTFNERSFAGNYVSDSLHLTLAVITYSHCRQQTNSKICSVSET